MYLYSTFPNNIGNRCNIHWLFFLILLCQIQTGTFHISSEKDLKLNLDFLGHSFVKIVCFISVFYFIYAPVFVLVLGNVLYTYTSRN